MSLLCCFKEKSDGEVGQRAVVPTTPIPDRELGSKPARVLGLATSAGVNERGTSSHGFATGMLDFSPLWLLASLIMEHI